MIAYATSRCVGDAVDEAGRRTWARAMEYFPTPQPVLFDRHQPDHSVSNAGRAKPAMRAPEAVIPYRIEDCFLVYLLRNRAESRLLINSAGREIVIARNALVAEYSANGRMKVRVLVRCKTCNTSRRVYPSDWNAGRGCGACYKGKRVAT